MKRGRRTGSPETREAILDAARELFAAHGFEATTLRAVAERAGVDVALCSYYFGSKAELFAAALNLPAGPVGTLTRAIGDPGDREHLAERILRGLMELWDSPAGTPLVTLVRSMASHRELLKAFVEEQMLPLMRSVIDGPDADLRAAGANAQALGLVMLRYALAVEPLASATHDEVVAAIAPTMQRYFDVS